MATTILQDSQEKAPNILNQHKSRCLRQPQTEGTGTTQECRRERIIVMTDTTTIATPHAPPMPVPAHPNNSCHTDDDDRLHECNFEVAWALSRQPISSMRWMNPERRMRINNKSSAHRRRPPISWRVTATWPWTACYSLLLALCWQAAWAREQSVLTKLGNRLEQSISEPSWSPLDVPDWDASPLELPSYGSRFSRRPARAPVYLESSAHTLFPHRRTTIFPRAPSRARLGSLAPFETYFPTITYFPTVAPTASSEPSTSDVPTHDPTGEPTPLPAAPIAPIAPTDITPAPAFTSPRPTLRPTRRPTLPPFTGRPSDIPSATPTTAHPITTHPITPQPTRPPTRRPTTMRPIESSSQEPSDSASRAPTLEPTAQPSVLPTEGPTPLTPKPTFSPQPTKRPSLPPSRLGSVSPTNVPTSTQSLLPTQNPSALSSQSPSLSLQDEVHNLNLVLHSTTGRLQDRPKLDFDSVTARFIQDSIEAMDLPVPIQKLMVDASIDEQNWTVPGSTARGRQLQGTSATLAPLQLSTTVGIKFRSLSHDYNLADWVAEAFNSNAKINAFMTRLQQSNSFFAKVTEVEVLVDGVAPIEEPLTTGGSSSPSTMTWIIIGAAAGALFIVAALGLVAVRKYYNRRDGMIGLSSAAGSAQGKLTGDGVPHSDGHHSTSGGIKAGISTEIVVDRQDDISTLGDPVLGGVGGMVLHDNGAERDERTASIGDDYDYAKMYLLAHGVTMDDKSARDRLTSSDSGGPTRVSSAGGGTTTTGGGHGVGGPMGTSVFADDASFEQQFVHDDEDGTEVGFDDDGAGGDLTWEVSVPPGRLGMVIDTPNGGVPVVHAIKPESVVAQQVKVGDALIRVDGQDVTEMTAVQVSKLISIKSGQTRHLVFSRPRSMRRRVGSAGQRQGGGGGNGASNPNYPMR